MLIEGTEKTRLVTSEINAGATSAVRLQGLSIIEGNNYDRSRQKRNNK